MAEGPSIHSDREGGIFIPYDKLLQQQTEKLDKILDEMREFDRRKLDTAVFDSFRAAYEQRHDVLKNAVVALDRGLVGRNEIIEEYRQSQKDIKTLQEDKAEREAVKANNRYYLAGGGLVGILVVVNLFINLAQIGGHG